MKKIVVMFSVLLCLLTTCSSLASSNNKETFEFKPDGSIYVNTLDCENTGLTHQHAKANRRSTKINGINYIVDEVEKVSSQFLRINGKLYDAYIAEFQRKNIGRTHYISNYINEKEFRVTDKEENYFTDGKNYYYHNNYPTFRACLFRNSKQSSSPIILSEFQLNSPEEQKFYLSQKSNIFVPKGYGGYGYSPYAELNDKLYFKRKNGKYVEVPDANPKTLRELSDTFGSHFYTDGQYIILQGNILDLELNTFKQIKAGKMHTYYFRIEDHIYHLHIPSGAFYYDAVLTKTNIDAETFEAIDTTGSFSGVLYQDKDYIYKLKSRATKFEGVMKIARTY